MARAAAARVAAPVRRAPARPAPARRPSGPAPARRRTPARRSAAARRPRIDLRARGVATLDALLHGPALIGLVFVLLVGIVFSNVALLQRNRTITQDAERVTTLKRENATLRHDVAELGSVDRIQQVAAERGLLLPAPGDIHYLRSNPRIDSRNAAKRLDDDAAAAKTAYVPPAPTYTAPAATTYTDPATSTAYVDSAAAPTYTDPAAVAPTTTTAVP